MRGSAGSAALAVLLLACGQGCRDRAPGADAAKPRERPRSPAARSIRVEEGRVIFEGRWQPFEVTDQRPAVSSSVQMICVQERGRCREEHEAPGAGGSEPAREAADYDVREWNSWKLVAVRRTTSGDEVEVQVALRGGAATKALTRKGSRDAETRWRLE